ncbi:MAG: hypothetical protein GY856_26650 [bacterium]|nr:hypothetical protein [bacterium]
MDDSVALGLEGAGVPPEGDKWGVPPEGDKWGVPPEGDKWGAAELRLERVEVEESPNYPLSLFVLPTKRLELRLVYDDGLFDEPTIERMLAHLAHLLEEVSRDPEQRLGELSLLAAGEREHLISVLAETRTWRWRRPPRPRSTGGSRPERPTPPRPPR